MQKSKVEEVGKDCLTKARTYARSENWPRAFPHYLMCLELFPNDKHQLEEEFTEVLYQLGILLEHKRQSTEVVKWYSTSLKYFPSSMRILNSFGEFLLRADQPELALRYLKSACALDQNFLVGEKNLLTAKMNIVTRWHFRMLNDRVRNGAYRTAIHNAIRNKHSKVLDIGAGCGLLSFYASEYKNTHSIIAVEASNALCTIAKSALTNNSVTVINKHSTLLSSADIRLSNILVTEIFDAGLFGEHVLGTLIHAWENLLEPSAKIVPQCADLFVTGIGSSIILARHKLCNLIPQLQLKNVCITQRTTEPYEAENLKQKSVNYFTSTEKALRVDFSNISQLKKLYEEVDSVPVFKLACVKSGTIDAFAIWFDLHLDDQVTITTNPLKTSVTCWEQAIIYLDHPVSLLEGETVTLQLSCVANKLKIKVLDPLVPCNQCFKVSPEIITFLNDVQIVETALNLELPDKYKVLDLNPFPIFALCMAKKGYSGHFQCVPSDPQDWQFINHIWSLNDCKINVELLEKSQLQHHLTMHSFDLIFINPVSENGTLCENTFQKLPQLQGALKPNGLILPMSVHIQVEAIDSVHLNFCNKVDNKNLFGFVVADQMNEYAVLEQWQIEPQYYNHKTLSNFTALCINFQNGCKSVSQNANASIAASGIANGFLCWYSLEFVNNVKIDTFNSLHYKSACFIIQQPRPVKEGDTLCVNIKQEQGLLKICCDNESI